MKLDTHWVSLQSPLRIPDVTFSIGRAELAPGPQAVAKYTTELAGLVQVGGGKMNSCRIHYSAGYNARMDLFKHAAPTESACEASVRTALQEQHARYGPRDEEAVKARLIADFKRVLGPRITIEIGPLTFNTCAETGLNRFQSITSWGGSVRLGKKRPGWLRERYRVTVEPFEGRVVDMDAER